MQLFPSMLTLVFQHPHKAVQGPVVEDRPVPLSVLLLVGFRDHLPLGEIANYHGAFNQSRGDEMRGFVQTVPVFVAFPFRNALVDTREVQVAARFLLAAIPLGANRIELSVVPLMALEATDDVDATLLVYARDQRLDA
jgi:hypothetical protein